MPFVTKVRFVPAKMFVKHKNVKVYHVYNDDVYDDPMTHYFTLHPPLDEDQDVSQTFDVRQLSTWTDAHPPFLNTNKTPENELAWKKWHAVGESDHIKNVIRQAIDKGELKKPL